MDSRCLKCGSDKYMIKTTIIPEKNPGLKVELGVYYIKICCDCGYAEFYSAKIVDEDKKEATKGEKYAKATT